MNTLGRIAAIVGILSAIGGATYGYLGRNLDYHITGFGVDGSGLHFKVKLVNTSSVDVWVKKFNLKIFTPDNIEVLAVREDTNLLAPARSVVEEKVYIADKFAVQNLLPVIAAEGKNLTAIVDLYLWGAIPIKFTTQFDVI